MPILRLSNGHIHVTVDSDLGAEITHVENHAGINMLFRPAWHSPIPASRSKSYGSDVLDWLSAYRGGWQELFPNAGNPSRALGTPLPFHGEVSRAIWDWEWLEEGTRLRLRVPTRLPLLLERTMTLVPDQPILKIEERIMNEAAFEVPYLWGHHPAFGPPLTEAGARIDVPAERVIVDAGLDGPTVDLAPGSEHGWPRATGRDDRSIDLSVIPPAPIERLCYLSDLEAGWYAIRNTARGLGLALAWDTATFPHLWMWQEIEGGQGMPWYGRGQITALEPASQWPSFGLDAALARGQAHRLPAHGEARTALTLALFEATERAVGGVTLDGQIQFRD